MNLIRPALAVTAATAMAALVIVAASACGRAATPTGAPDNGLEKKSPADVLQAAAAALQAAKSVHIVGTGPAGRIDFRMQDGSSTGTFTTAGHQLRLTIVGSDDYINTDRAGLRMLGAPPQVQRHDAGRWIKIPASAVTVTGLTLADLASQLTAYKGPLDPKVRQATVNGGKVVVVSWRNGSTLDVANTGPAYPLLAVFKVHNPGRIDFSEYGAPLHIAAPRNAIDSSKAG